MFELLIMGTILCGVIARITKKNNEEDQDDLYADFTNINNENSSEEDNDYPAPRTW